MTPSEHGPDNGIRQPVDDHLDVDTVADLIENLLPASEAHRARDHIKGCPDCQQTYDALIELSADLAEEGRAEIPMPAHVAEHLDSVIVSEAMLRSSTVGVHSLTQFATERKRLPRLLLGAAAAVLVCAVGVGVLVAVRDESDNNAAATQPSDGPPRPQVSSLPQLSTGEVGNQVQQLLESAPARQIITAGAAEAACAKQFAMGQPNRTLRLVQPATVEGRRSTVIAMQARGTSDVRVYVVTGCDSSSALGTDASVSYVTTVTLRNR